MFRRPLLICVFVVSVVCEVADKKGEARKARLFSFNTVNEDISINLEFSIPFLTIPTKKAADSVFGLWSSGLPTININPGALALGGAAVLGTSLLLPLFLKNYAMHYPHQRVSRLLDSTEFSTDGVLDLASQILSDSRSVHGCATRIACWAARRGATSESSSAWKQIMSNNLLSSVINSTVIEDAMLSGKEGRDCMTYTPCPLREDYIPVLFRNLDVLSNLVG